ncbi:MAG: T9SS type B sorting domain-containing protein [Chitinophagaceae bacterium]
MKTNKLLYDKIKAFPTLLLLALVISCYTNYTNAQMCPANIDFESGTFTGWRCYIGSTAAINNKNVISLNEVAPTPGRHTMLPLTYPGELDPYGGFPINCPNGSGYSIKLGNDQAETQAEGVSYEFTIPANQNEYSLIYNYAVVFEDPNHEIYQQPRMEIEILNVTDNTVIDCSSFAFIPLGSGLPGFFESPIIISTASIWCKDWTAVSVNLDGLAGKTIRLFFKTADCTFRRHFGYAYIDVNSECNSEFVGATYCPDDTAVVVNAPFGYQNYKWFNNSFTQVLGNQQNIRFEPPPPAGTRIAVEMTPYNGYGCLDTLYALLIDTLTTVANAGNDALSCNYSPVQIGIKPKGGLVYSWTPKAGLSNPEISNPFASPATTTNYTLSVRSVGGGCLKTDDVLVVQSAIDSTLLLKGKLIFCEGFGDSCVLTVPPEANIQWFKNNIAIPGAKDPSYKVLKTGDYYALLINNDGCQITSTPKHVIIDKAVAAITYPLAYAVTGLPLQLNARAIGSTAIWHPSVHLDNANSYSPVFTSTINQSYIIELTTTTGCITLDKQDVQIVPFVEIHVPTAFTPNNDGLNDFLRPALRGIKELRYFKVFNRWGQILYESKNENPGWNGNINGIQQSSQTLVWTAEGIGVDNKTYFRKGTTTLLR